MRFIRSSFNSYERPSYFLNEPGVIVGFNEREQLYKVLFPTLINVHWGCVSFFAQEDLIVLVDIDDLNE